MVTHTSFSTSDSTSTPSSLLLVGGGPRSVIQTNAEIVFIMLYRAHFEDLINLGAKYDISTTIVEAQPRLGVGNAYNNGQTGMMNTGVESDITFPLPLPSNSKKQKVLLSLLSYSKRFARLIGDKPQQYYEEVKTVNLPGAVMFKNALGPMSTTMDGQLEHERAYLMRGSTGIEELMTTSFIFRFANAMLPFYNVHVMSSTKARHITLSDDNKNPTVLLESKETGSFNSIEASQVRLNCGTVTKNPILNTQMHHLMFCESMSAFRFREYCAHRHLIDENGLLKSGVKIISGGMGLSALDQLSVLDYVMKLFEEDQSALGYRVSEQAKQRYQGAITMISRTPANQCMPKHSFSMEWKQDTPVLGNAKHLHALFLHNFGEEVLGLWMKIVKAAVARAQGVMINETDCSAASTEELLRGQFLASLHFMQSRHIAGKLEKVGEMVGKQLALRRSTKTLYGAWRQAALGTIFGIGLETNTQDAIDEMSDFAPVTWKGREVWLFHRAQLNSVSDPRFALESSNKSYFRNFDFLMKHVTSSPVEIHSMFHLLVEAGIAKYERASYSDMTHDISKDSIQMKGEAYDMLVVSPAFDRMSDEAVMSLVGQAKPINERHASFGQVGKFRRFADRKGKLSSVEDFGLGGKGFSADAKDGGKSQVGVFATDVNNRASGVSIASSITLRRMAIAHLNAAGVPEASKVVDEIYTQSKASVAEYEEEVMKFAKYFEEAYEIGAYIDAISVASGKDFQRLWTLYDNGMTKEGREAEIEKLASAKGLVLDQEAAVLYTKMLTEIPEFKPPSRDEYLNRFVDMTEDEARFVYWEAMKMARSYLHKNKYST